MRGSREMEEESVGQSLGFVVLASISPFVFVLIIALLSC
jgi:hypothetical protein